MKKTVKKEQEKETKNVPGTGKKEGTSVEMVFILDKSGSMSGLEKDTVGGFNSMIGKQKSEEGRAFVTTVLFDTTFKTVHDRLPLEEVPKLTEKDYVPGGCTALLDALGQTIEHVKDIHRYIRPEDVPAKTVFVITTDGYENTIRRYTAPDVKKLIEAQKEAGWEFLFLGANIDAVETAGRYGIGADCAATYTCDEQGTAVNFEAVSCALKEVRAGKGSVPRTWKKAIEEDHAKKRK